MAETFLEPIVSPNAGANFNVQAIPNANQVPENAFEDVLNNVAGTTETLSFLSQDGLAYAAAENPSMGSAVVSTAISNLSASSPQFGGGGFGRPGNVGFSGGFGGGQGFPLGGSGGFPGAVASAPGFSGGSFGGGGTVDGISPDNVKQGILDEGIAQILLMAEVQQAARTIDAFSNILKTKHDADMNTIRNIRS